MSDHKHDSWGIAGHLLGLQLGYLGARGFLDEFERARNVPWLWGEALDETMAWDYVPGSFDREAIERAVRAMLPGFLAMAEAMIADEEERRRSHAFDLAHERCS